MHAIERFFTNMFGYIITRIRYSVTFAAERKVRETFENQYNRAVASKDKKGDRKV